MLGKITRLFSSQAHTARSAPPPSRCAAEDAPPA
jgi:hypothetical protein